MTISLPSDLYVNLATFKFCAIFSFHKHPVIIRRLTLVVWVHYSAMASVKWCINFVTSTCIHLGIIQFVPFGVLSQHWSRCTWVEFSFLSGGTDVSSLNCGIDLVYYQNLEEFTSTMHGTMHNLVRSLHKIVLLSLWLLIWEPKPFKVTIFSRGN